MRGDNGTQLSFNICIQDLQGYLSTMEVKSSTSQIDCASPVYLEARTTVHADR